MNRIDISYANARPGAPHTATRSAQAPNCAYDEGFEAALVGRAFETNPYSGYVGSMWEDGYLLALRERRGSVIKSIQLR